MLYGNIVLQNSVSETWHETKEEQKAVICFL